jgi:hypothetical protein
VLGEDALVVGRRLGALAVGVVDAGQQVAGVGAEDGVGEGRELVERLAGVEIVLEEEMGEAVVVEGQPAVAALVQEAVLEERGDRGEGLLRFGQPQQHLGLVAAGAGGPLEVGREVLVGVGLLDAAGEGLDGGGVLPGRLLEALAGGGAPLRPLLGLGGGLGQLGEAEGAVGVAEVVEGERVVGQVLVAGGRLEVRDGLGVVAVGPLDQAEGQAVAGGGGLLVAAELLEELAEAGGGEGEILLVVGPAGAAE